MVQRRMREEAAHAVQLERRRAAAAEARRGELEAELAAARAALGRMEAEFTAARAAARTAPETELRARVAALEVARAEAVAALERERAATADALREKEQHRYAYAALPRMHRGAQRACRSQRAGAANCARTACGAGGGGAPCQ